MMACSKVGMTALHRLLVSCGVLACLVPATVRAGGPAQADLSGIWLPTRTVTAIRTDEGKLPPLKPEAARTYRERVAARAAGKPIPDSTTFCQPDGVPRLMYAPLPFQILQRPEQVTFLHEKGHMFRVIPVGAPEPVDPDPIFLGHSVGAWRDGELVVTTVGFNTLTTLDRAGLPHSEAMRVTEAYRLSRGGKRLTVRFTIDDPDAYERPWTTSLTFRRLPPGQRIKEHVCQLTNPEFKSYYVKP